ncbi:phage tail tube protein [Roseobacter sp. S98]|uniref:phage tail tube protein n=1 Tax=Roseobacter algicola (ex Choi et al. 2025) (nom. illeg.) TaxID=3092138 RepID=UPI003F514BF0
MAIFWRSKILLAEIETTYGTDAGPDGADGILAKEVTLSGMEGNDLDRALEQPYFGSQGTVPVELHARISFKVELAPSGTAGTAPPWGKLLRACGVAETVVANTSVTYNPITEEPEAVSVHFFVGNTRFVMLGTRGTVSIEMSANQIPHLMFEFTGLFTLPSEQARPAVDLSAWQRPQQVSRAFTSLTLDGNAGLVMRSFMMSFGNQVEPRFLVGPEAILITDKDEQIEMTLEAVPLTTYDPYAAAFNQDEVPVILQHGVGAGRIATLNAPTAQMQRPQGVETPQNITEWPLRLKPIPTAGNDQWTLVLT